MYLLAVANITIFTSAVYHQKHSQRISSGLLAVLETEGLCLMQPVSHLLTDELTKCPKCYPSVPVFPTCSTRKNIHLKLKLTSSLGLTFIDRNKTKQLNLQLTKEQQQQKSFEHQFTQTQPRLLPQGRVFQQFTFHLTNDSNFLPTHAASFVTIYLLSHYLSWKSEEPVQKSCGVLRGYLSHPVYQGRTCAAFLADVWVIYSQRLWWQPY